MIRVNGRLLLKLFVLIAFFAGGLYGLHAYQSQRIPQAMLWQVNHAIEQGKTDDAIKYMRRYLELCPNDYEQTLKLADLMQARATSAKELTNAIYLYEKVMREAPQETRAAKQFIPACIRLGRHADALRVAEEYIKAKPSDGEVHGFIAECLMSQNKNAEAKLAFQEGLRLAPGNVRISEMYSRLLTARLNQPKEALAILDALVKANPRSAEAYLLRARALHADRNDAEASKDIDQLFWHDPENIEGLLLSAEIEQLKGNNRRAKDTLLAMLDLTPRDVRGYRALSWLNLLTGNSTEAMQTLERGLTRLPDSPELLTPLGDLCLEQGDIERTMDIIKKLDSKGAATSQAKYLKARVLMKQNKHKDALAILEPLRAEVLALPAVEQQVSMLLAGSYERVGQFSTLREILKRMLAKDPNNLTARLAMANMFLDAGQLLEASKEYDLAAKSPIAGVGVRIMAGKLRIQRLKMDGKTKPADWNDLENSVSELIRVQPNSIEPILLMAELHAAKKDTDQAVETIRQALRQRPADSRLWVALANLVWKERGTYDAIEVLNEARAVAGDSSEWKLARARLLCRMNNAPRLDQLTGSLANMSEADRIRLWQGLVDLLELTGHTDLMLAACKELANLSSQELTPRRLMYREAIIRGDTATADRLAKQLRQIVSHCEFYPEIIAGLAERDYPAERQFALKKIAEQARMTNPEMVESHWLMARIAHAMNDTTTAKAEYATAIQMDPLNVPLCVERVRFLEATGQQTVVQQIQQQLTHDPRYTLPRLHAIRRQLNASDTVWPIEHADHHSDELLGNATKGNAEYRTAVAKTEKAIGRTKLIPLLAILRHQLGQQIDQWKPDLQTSAEFRQFASACVAHGEFIDQPDAALVVLNGLANEKNADAADRQWAKELATSIQLRTNKKSTDINVLLGTEPANIAEHRQRVNLLNIAIRSTQSSDKDRLMLAMIKSLNAITNDPSANVAEWYQLSQLYRSVGDQTNARRCLQELLKRQPNNLPFLAVYVDDALAAGRVSDVEPLLAKLQSGIHDIRVASVLAKALALLNDAAGTLETTDQFVKAVDAGSADGVIRQRQAAELLDQLARMMQARHLSGYHVVLEGACERYRAVSVAYPETIGSWVALLALSGRPEKAFEELERRQQRLSPTDLAFAGMKILRTGKTTAKQTEQVGRWLAAVQQEQPKSIPILLNVAEWQTMQQKYPAAATVYRFVLQDEPKHLVALNNLAWILAADRPTADEALTLIDRAIKQYGRNPELLDTRARVLISLQRHAEAKELLQEVLNISQTPARYFHLALALKQDPTEAIQAFKQAAQRGLTEAMLHPNDVHAYRELLSAVK